MNEELELINEKLNVVSHDAFIVKRAILKRYFFRERITYCLVMFPITQRQFLELEKKPTLFKIEGITVCSADIKVYGEVDFEDKGNIDGINRLLSLDIDEYHYIPQSFNYENNTSLSATKGISFNPTKNNLNAFKYYHAMIGKPEYIIVVKLAHDTLKKHIRD